MKNLRHKKLVKRVKHYIPWIEHIINDEKSARDLNPHNELNVWTKEKSLCLSCRGSKMLCGKPRCPIILKLYSFVKTRKRVNSKHLVGSSPPALFVGRIGYPHVYAGPLVPPILGDTSLFDTPERWLDKTVDDIVSFRTNLIRGKFRVNVKKPFDNKRFHNKTLEIALSKDPVETELTFQNKLSNNFVIDEIAQPMGPSAVLKNMRVETSKSEPRIVKAYYDTDLNSEEAVLDLYLNNVSVSKIQRSFSVGAFGLKKLRRMVPTRWSITAVDSIISRRIIDDEIKRKKSINEYRVYEHNYLGNNFVILLTPSNWRYEWIEAWYPGTTWNPQGTNVAMGSDWEGYKGRKKYASIGGCYYAVRLAAAEFLFKENRQAGVIAMREIQPSFITPLGVWINRECVREAFRKKSKKFNDFGTAIAYINSKFSINIKEWTKTSVLLKDQLYQEKISKYF